MPVLEVNVRNIGVNGHIDSDLIHRVDCILGSTLITDNLCIHYFAVDSTDSNLERKVFIQLNDKVNVRIIMTRVEI